MAVFITSPRIGEEMDTENLIREKIASKLRIYEAGLRDIGSDKRLNTTQRIVLEESARMEFITDVFALFKEAGSPTQKEELW